MSHKITFATFAVSCWVRRAVGRRVPSIDRPFTRAAAVGRSRRSARPPRAMFGRRAGAVAPLDRSLPQGDAVIHETTPVLEPARLPGPQGGLGIARIGSKAGGQGHRVCRRLGGRRRRVRPQDERRVAEQAGAPERHARHRHVEDDLDERVRGRLDQLGEARVQLACGSRVDFSVSSSGTMPAATEPACSSPFLSVSSRSSLGPAGTLTYHTQLSRRRPSSVAALGPGMK